MRWLLYILKTTNRFVTDRKGRKWGIVVVICCIGIYLVTRSFLIPRDVAYPENPLSAEYQSNLNYIIKASMQTPPDFSEIRGGFLGSHLAIVDENDFPLLTKKLEYDLYRAARDDFFFHSFVLGGLSVRNIDQPLLEACKRFRMRRSNVKIVIVAPSTISAETKSVLEKKGIQVQLIGLPSDDRLQ